MSITTVSTTPPRTIGPVTTASGGAVAVSVIITWLVQQIWSITIPPEVQGSIAVVLVIIAGFLVKPRVVTVTATPPAPAPDPSAPTQTALQATATNITTPAQTELEAATVADTPKHLAA